MVQRARSSSSGASGGSGGDVVVTPPGDSDATVDQGAQTETSLDSTTVISGPIEQGTQTESDLLFDMAATIPEGTQTESFNDDDATGTGLIAIGSQAEDSLDSITVITGDVEQGSETDSFQADALATIADYTNSTTITTPNTPAWTNDTNAQGNFDGSEANHSGFGGALDLDGFDSTLECSGLNVISTPPSFTQGDVYVQIRHRWDLDITLAVAGVTDVTQDIDLMDSGGTLIANLSQRLASGGGGTQATLIDEVFNITGIASPAQLAAGIQVHCHFYTTGVPTAAVNGNTSWDVDAIHLLTDFTWTGIS